MKRTIYSLLCVTAIAVLPTYVHAALKLECKKVCDLLGNCENICNLKIDNSNTPCLVGCVGNVCKDDPVIDDDGLPLAAIEAMNSGHTCESRNGINYCTDGFAWGCDDWCADSTGVSWPVRRHCDSGSVTIIGDRDLELTACIDDSEAVREVAVAAMDSGLGDLTVCIDMTGVCEPVEMHPACCEEGEGCGLAIGCDIACCILSILNEGCGGCLE